MISLWGGDKGLQLPFSNCPLSQPLATSFLGNRSESGSEGLLPISVFLCGSICHDSLGAAVGFFRFQCKNAPVAHLVNQDLYLGLPCINTCYLCKHNV